MKVLIIVAMEAELKGFLEERAYEMQQIQGFTTYVSRLGTTEIYLSKSEVGKVNAAMLTTALCLKIRPRYIINAGIAGALNPTIAICQTIASTKVAQHDFDLTAFGLKKGELDNHDCYFKASGALLCACDHSVTKGLIVSGDQFLSTKEQLSQVKRDFPKALACDMEGAAIAQVATYLKRKFIILRTISDNPYQENQIHHYEDNKQQAIAESVRQTIVLLQNIQ